MRIYCRAWFLSLSTILNQCVFHDFHLWDIKTALSVWHFIVYPLYRNDIFSGKKIVFEHALSPLMGSLPVYIAHVFRSSLIVQVPFTWSVIFKPPVSPYLCHLTKPTWGTYPKWTCAVFFTQTQKDHAGFLPWIPRPRARDLANGDTARWGLWHVKRGA